MAMSRAGRAVPVVPFCIACLLFLAPIHASGGDHCDNEDEDSVALFQSTLSVNKVVPPVEALRFPNPSGLLQHRDVPSDGDSIKPSDGNSSKNSYDAILEDLGIELNGEGDLSAFLSALMTNIAMVVGQACFFMVARRMYEHTYSDNVRKGVVPAAVPGTSEILLDKEKELTFSWARAAWRTDNRTAAACIGLDCAMLLQFNHLCMRILAILGVPLLCILAPMHYAFGGQAAGEDHLSYLSMGNVEEGSWLYWVHAFVIWFTVITVVYNIYTAQRDFLPRRYKWLKSMPEPRASTVLVESLPAKYQSDARLRQFFGRLFNPQKIKSVYVVRRTSDLVSCLEARKTAETAKEKAELVEAARREKGEAPGPQYDHQQVIDMADCQVKIERTKIKESLATTGGADILSCNAFVTFVDRNDAEIAKSLQYCRDLMDFEVSTPPSTESVIWSSLEEDPRKRTGKLIIGYGLIAVIFVLYLPIVIWITNLATSIDLGPFQSLWEGLAPTLGLFFMVSFLPTFLILIFNAFFDLQDTAWTQHKLQGMYFFFQMFFVVFVTAIGSNATAFVKTLVQDPFSVFGLFAQTMPYATHFYMNFMALQWATHFTNFIRAAPLVKFLGASRIWDEEAALNLAEPEDQDYYGIGSRSARFTINMVIGIVFGTLCPPLILLTFINFAICKLVYGYLIVFAERKKPDLGGVFWVSSLRHLFWGLIVYCVVMIGVLGARAKTNGPVCLGAPAIIYVIVCFLRFDSAYAWEKLPIAELVEPDESEKDVDKPDGKTAELLSFLDAVAKQAKADGQPYVQPELIDM